MRSLLYVAAGALFSLSCFVFADGFVIAKRMGVPYNFLMWLPCIMIFSGMFVLSLVDVKVVADVNYSFSDNDVVRDKAFFFAAALLIVGGLAIALWKAIDPYGNLSNAWPGFSLVIQNVLLVLCIGVLFSVRLRNEESLF